MDDESRQNLREGFAADMAEHQKLTGKMPTPAENERLAVPIFEMLEQKMADRAARDPDVFMHDPMPADEAHQHALRSEVERRGRPGAADRLSIQRLPDKEPVLVQANQDDLERGMRMLRRLEFLLGKPESGVLGGPSWRQRALGVLALKQLRANRKRVAFELAQLCEDSVLPFGAWDVPEGHDRPLIFT